MSMFKAWTKEEESNLLIEFKELSIDEIATKHDRTKRAIEIRLQDIAVKMEQDGVSHELIFTATGVSKETILVRIKEKEKKKPNTSELKEIKLELRIIKLELKEIKLELK